MNDLISREATIDAMENTDWYHQNQNGEMVHGASSEDQAWYKAEDVYGVLERMSSVHPERKNGEWTIDEDCEGKSRTVTCNLCGYEEFNWYNPNFCPNCGADMRGEQDD